MTAASAWADEVLALLRREPVTRAKLAHDLALNGAAVQAALDELRARGYSVETDAAGMLRLAAIPDLLLADEIEHAIADLHLGRPLHTFGKVGSTNTVASELASAGAPEGTLVTAEEQSRGRGRQGRSWNSPPGVGIWMSIVLRPPVEPAAAAGLSLVAGLAVAEALRGEAEVNALVKWPNDVYVDGRKVAGVLCESVLEGKRVRYTVMGIGINVNQTAAQIPHSLQVTAASLHTVTGRIFRRVPVLAAVLRELELRYRQYCGDGFAPLRDEYRKLSWLAGQPVTVTQGEREIHGRVVDIAPDGALLVESATRIERVQVGDATMRIDPDAISH